MYTARGIAGKNIQAVQIGRKYLEDVAFAKDVRAMVLLDFTTTAFADECFVIKPGTLREYKRF